MRNCIRCKRDYEFKCGRGMTTQLCSACWKKVQRDKKKRACVEYLGGKCSLCGYDRCLRALDFHHLDPTTKKFGISGTSKMSFDVLKSELDKCVLLCNRCHAEVEDGYTVL
jgi:hypothetical protein